MSKEKFSEIRDLFNRTSHEVCIVVESYHIWRTLEFSLSIPEVGKETAEKNAQLMNLYKDFFIPTIQSHLQTFVIGLMKFFDKNPSALSIKGLMGEVQSNKSDLTIEDLKNAHPHLEEIDAVPTFYDPIKEETVAYIDAVFKKHESLVSNLKNIRDKELAHIDIKPHRGNFVPREIEVLINDIQEIFNKLSNDFDLSATTFDFVKQESINAVRYLFENLERGEVQRKEEIRQKYGF